jgi:hypothetical protein
MEATKLEKKDTGFPCFFCDKTYTNESPRNIHLYSNHFGGYNCDRCIWHTGRRATLRDHYKKHHQRDLDKAVDYAAMPKEQRENHKREAIIKKGIKQKLHLDDNNNKPPPATFVGENLISKAWASIDPQGTLKKHHLGNHSQAKVSGETGYMDSPVTPIPSTISLDNNEIPPLPMLEDYGLDTKIAENDDQIQPTPMETITMTTVTMDTLTMTSTTTNYLENNSFMGQSPCHDIKGYNPEVLMNDEFQQTHHTTLMESAQQPPIDTSLTQDLLDTSECYKIQLVPHIQNMSEEMTTNTYPTEHSGNPTASFISQLDPPKIVSITPAPLHDHILDCSQLPVVSWDMVTEIIDRLQTKSLNTALHSIPEVYNLLREVETKLDSRPVLTVQQIMDSTFRKQTL